MLNVQDFMDLYLDGLFATIELWDCEWCKTIFKGTYADMPLKFEYATVESFNLTVDNNDAVLVLNVRFYHTITQMSIPTGKVFYFPFLFLIFIFRF